MNEPSTLMKHAPLVIGVLVISSFMAFVLVVVYFHPPIDPNLQGTILGILGSGGFITVVNYFFGSSSGSSAKDSTIKDALSKKEP